MLENEEKGSYGTYSSAGKNSIEIFANLRRKDKILNPQNQNKNKLSIIDFLKRNGYHNIHGDDQQFKHPKSEDLDESQLEEVEEEIDIFKMEATKKLNKKPSEKKKKKKVNENEPNYYHRTEKEAYKFHDLHRQKGTVIRPDTTPTCTKYLPSKKLVWRKTINWPGWETMKGRKPFVEEKNSKFYINHGNILSQVGPCLINMNKQTMRGDSIPESHNLRIITTRPFTPNSGRNNNLFLKNSYNKKNKKMEINIDNQYYDKNNKIFIKNNYKKNINSNDIGQNRYNYIFEENQKVNNNEMSSKYMNKRGVSAATSSTRPQTGKPLNINRFQSRPTTSSPNGTLASNKNIIDNNNAGTFNTNKSHITSKSVSNEEEEINDAKDNENDNKISKNNYNDNNENNDNNNSISEDSSDLNDSYNKFKNVYQRQIKKKNLTENKMSKNSIFDKKKNKNKKKKMQNMKIKIESSNSYGSLLSKNSIRPKSMVEVRYMIHSKKIKGPDFKKIISREYYDNLDDRGSSLIPFSLPNFKQVRERPITMVSYERPHYDKRKTNYMKGIEPSMYNDQYKYLEFINNHTRCVPPNLDKMMARPKDDGSPLPVYMKGCVSREACNITTDVSLKMNNFSEGKFLSSYTSFWPKKSFNKIINLNLLNSDTFISNFVNDKKRMKNSGNYIAKSIRFYKKNFKDLMKEGLLTKFDNITYKTIRPNNKIESKELERFLKNYENEKKNELF